MNAAAAAHAVPLPPLDGSLSALYTSALFHGKAARQCCCSTARFLNAHPYCGTGCASLPCLRLPPLSSTGIYHDCGFYSLSTS